MFEPMKIKTIFLLLLENLPIAENGCIFSKHLQKATKCLPKEKSKQGAILYRFIVSPDITIL